MHQLQVHFGLGTRVRQETERFRFCAALSAAFINQYAQIFSTLNNYPSKNTKFFFFSNVAFPDYPGLMQYCETFKTCLHCWTITYLERVNSKKHNKMIAFQKSMVLWSYCSWSVLLMWIWFMRIWATPKTTQGYLSQSWWGTRQMTWMRRTI